MATSPRVTTIPESTTYGGKETTPLSSTSFAVRPRTRLSFGYFSLEDKEK
ncbi:hypothetical protein [Burkholderia sola]